MSLAEQLNASLTAENFVQKIKEMDNRDRNRLQASVLIRLIVQLPDEYQNLNRTVQDILVSMNQMQQNVLPQMAS